MATDKSRSYGLMIVPELKQDWRTIQVRIMQRKEGEGFPLNVCDSDSEHEGRADLVLNGWFSNYTNEFAVEGACYRDVHDIGPSKIGHMAKMLARCVKQFQKDSAHEPGDVFMSFAKAIGAEWVVYEKEPGARYRTYSDTEWRWGSVAQGREMYRRIIAEEGAKQALTNPLPAKSAA
jgi:hypothetical protein